MTCRQIVEFLLAYLHDELAPRQRLLFEEHFAECPDCTAYLHAYRTTMLVTRLSSKLAEETRNTMPEGLVRAIVLERGCSVAGLFAACHESL